MTLEQFNKIYLWLIKIELMVDVKNLFFKELPPVP